MVRWSVGDGWTSQYRSALLAEIRNGARLDASDSTAGFGYYGDLFCRNYNLQGGC